MLIFNKEKRTESRINKALEQLPTYGNNQIYSHAVEICNNLIYVKIFHEGNLSQDDLDSLYNWGVNRFTKLGYDFHGLICYNDNHEVCLDFIKD